jgi:hypothetical protein
MCCAYLYADHTGRELFRLTDPGDELPVPSIGETIKFKRNRYQIESVKVIESPNPATLATEYRIRMLRIEAQR